MLTIVSLALLVAAATAQKCCTPDQWEGAQGGMTGYSKYYIKTGSVGEVGKVHYDYTNRRTASTITFYEGKEGKKFHMVLRYEGDEGTLYVVDVAKEKCWRKKAEGKFRRACVPDDAIVNGNFSIGPLNGGLQVSSYSLFRKSMQSSFSVTSSGCIPVSELNTGSSFRLKFMQIIGFMDITPGIKDTSVFDIPEECEDGEHDIMMMHHITRQDLFLAI